MPNDFGKRIYIKDERYDPIYKTVNKAFLFKSRILPVLLIFVSIGIVLSQILVPIYFFETQDDTPEVVSNSFAGVATGFSSFRFKELGSANSFAKEGGKLVQTTYTQKPEFFYITIPKLGINKAKVETASTDLNPENSLGHYNGSALPGEVGNAFVYGHSVLPAFYNPRNYKTIFSTLDNLEEGDKFQVMYDDKTLNYVVTSKRSLSPKDVNPLEVLKPDYLNESTMVLMTCTPPGTKFKRLLIPTIYFQIQWKEKRSSKETNKRI